MDVIQSWINSLLGQGILNVLIALLILIVGWIVARIIARVVRGILRRFKIDQWFSNLLSDEEDHREIKVENFVTRLTYWILMLFVFVAVFERLGLDGIAGPIGAFLEEFTATYLPRLAGATLLFLVGWVVATVFKYLVQKLATITKLDEWMSKHGALEKGEQVTFVKTLANAIFWLIMFVFLGPVLSTLGVQPISDQIQLILDQIFAYLPNILAAGLVFIIGVFAARAVRSITTKLLRSIGIDDFGQRIGLSESRSFSELIATILYILIMLIISVTALRELDIAAISEPMTQILNQIIGVIPGLIGAAVLLAVAYAVGRVVVGLVKDLLANIGFDKVPEKIGISWSSKQTPSEWVEWTLLVVIMLFAATSAFELLGSLFLVNAMNVFIGFLGHVFLAVVIFAFGLYFANLAYKIIHKTGVNQANLLGRASQVAIIFFAGSISLQEVGVGADVINIFLGIILSAVGLALALSFGLGTQRVAERELENVIDALRDKDK